jgi:hypothetical protein
MELLNDKNQIYRGELGVKSDTALLVVQGRLSTHMRRMVNKYNWLVKHRHFSFGSTLTSKFHAERYP